MINLEYQYIYISHKNVTHISNVVKHILMLDMHTLLP